MADSELPPRGDGSIPPPPHDDRDSKRRFVERVVPMIVKKLVERAVETGVEKLAEQPENLRNLLADMKLPKEVLHDVYGQIDDTKTGLYRVVAKEIRDVLEHTQIADEIVKVLTKLSFEIKTEIRFVPNDRSLDKSADREKDEAEEGDASAVRPKVTTEVTVKERGAEKRVPKKEDR